MRKNPVALFLIPTLLLLAGCGHDLFADRGVPRTATEVSYAKDVCEEAGPKSRACDDARRQMDLRCYGTIGTVDCYRSDDPFGMTERDRAALAPIDRRPTRSSEIMPPEKPVMKVIAAETPAPEPAATEPAAADAAPSENSVATGTEKPAARTTDG